MKKVSLVALAFVVFAVPMMGCLGPLKLTRGFDDWVNQGYVNDPWLYGNSLSYGLIGFGLGVTWALDGIAGLYYFWGMDAQPFGSGKGTAFHHVAIKPGKKKR